ncbi:MAG TPA: peptidoglycan-binding protein, partial [Bacteroidia bacterium]|nr:peptidoglycan-binding protein [Bacteroidia bacterium]
MKRFLFFLVPACILVFGGCGGKPENPAGETQVVADDPEKINKLIADYLHDHFAKADTSKRFRISADSITAYPEVIKFYSSLGDKPIWSDKGKLNASGDSMWAVVKDAESYGLIPGDYHYSVIDSLLKNSYDSVKEQFNVNRLAQTDMMLTDAFFTFAVHVSVGRIDNDSSTARSWKIHRLDTDLVSVLASTLKANTFRKTFAALEPQRMEYQSIKKYMNDYRRKYAGITWAHLPDRKEDSTGFFAGVKERLIEYGDYDTASTEKDSLKLSNALKKFQKRFFLEQDGKIGRNTILTLDMTPQDWTRQLAMNMERWRWEPEKFEKRHMIVNLPVFKMTVWEADTIVMQSKIVCGAVKTQTPELDSKMNQIILYPFWNVPYS